MIKTAQKLGVRTVAVFSAADRGAKHVAMADEAVFIGNAVASESYLDGGKVLNAALATGADVILYSFFHRSSIVKFSRGCECRVCEGRVGDVFLSSFLSFLRVHLGFETALFFLFVVVNTGFETTVVGIDGMPYIQAILFYFFGQIPK